MAKALIFLHVFAICFGVSVQGSCFHHTPTCEPHNVNLATCVGEGYACHDNQMCLVVVGKHGTVADCKAQNEMDTCLQHSANNEPACSPTSAAGAHHDCTYCCENMSCIQNLVTSSSVSSAQTVTSTQSVHEATTATHVVEPPKGSCHTSACNSGDDLATCTAGQWACAPAQHCHIHLAANGDLHNVCEDERVMQHCLDQMHGHHADLCTPYPGSTAGVHGPDCHYCCTNEECVKGLVASGPAAASSAPAACHDLFSGSCSVTYAGQCSDPLVARICPKTCNTCTTTTVTTTPPPTTPTTATTTAPTTVLPTTTVATTTPEPCADLYLGDCGVDFAGLCDQKIVSDVCKKSCGLCSVTVASICTDKFTGDCAATFPGQCSDPVVRDVCAKTCGLCHDSGSVLAGTTVAAEPCIDLHPGNCTTDFGSTVPCRDSLVSFACRKTCNICQDAVLSQAPPVIG